MSGMRYRRLGGSGLTVSVVGVGCINFGPLVDARAAREVVAAALDEGITLFDTADRYGLGASEEYLGSALGRQRDRVVIATKFGMDATGGRGHVEARAARRYVVRALEASLRRLGTDYIDLYQLHVPEPATPLAETMAALDDLVRAGKVRYLGHSQFTGWQVADAAWVAREGGLTPFISTQAHYHLLHRDAERELVPACQRFGLGLLPFAPLASGLLTGKYQRGQAPPAGTRLAAAPHATMLAQAPWDTIEALTRYAEQRGRTTLELAIGALAAKPAVASVIAGATTPAQVRANVAAAAWRPSPDDLSAIDVITRG